LLDVALDIVRRIKGPGYCSPTVFWAVGFPLDWGGFILSGWILGRLFRERALAVTSVGAFFFLAKELLGSMNPEQVSSNIAACLGTTPPSAEDLPHNIGMIAMILGITSRGYVSVIIARIASRAKGPTAQDE